MNYTRWIAGAVVLTLGSLAMGGCYYSDGRTGGRGGSSSYGGSSDAETEWTSPLHSYAGSMGSVATIDTSNGTVVGRDAYDGSSTSVRIDAENTQARWWAMTALTIDGSINHPALVPGAHLVFDGTNVGGGSGYSDLDVQALGCSGPSHGDYTFDHPASTVTMDVSNGPAPNTRLIAFTATFDGGAQRVAGSFVADAQ